MEEGLKKHAINYSLMREGNVSVIDGWIGSRIYQSSLLSESLLKQDMPSSEKGRERDCQITTKLIPCPHANSVVLCYYILDQWAGLLQFAGCVNGGIDLVGDFAGLGTGGFDGFHNFH